MSLQQSNTQNTLLVLSYVKRAAYARLNNSSYSLFCFTDTEPLLILSSD
nr:MAG TPA: hypothetical protein [Caudoviricetes sp.]